MNRRWMLLGALTLAALVTTGCSVQDSAVQSEGQDTGVDIVIPYVTTTIPPEETPSPDAFFIDADGLVQLKDKNFLDGSEKNASTKSPYSQLRLGSTGNAVSAMQERLAELGYFSGGISGVFDADTENAVKLFEQGYGIMQTGIATAAMQERLYGEGAMVYKSDAYMEAVYSHYSLLEKGDAGSGVVALQSRLKELGYPIRDITGLYDAQTVLAVNLFYEAYGYEGRDYAIVDLQKALFSDKARAYTPPAEAPDDEKSLTLGAGDSGTRVTQVQMRLKELGYLENVTGEYDAQTVQAVNDFQTSCQMEKTGIAQVALQKLLFSEDAPRKGETMERYSLLQWGDSGEKVRSLQNRLIELGYPVAEANGVYSDDTVTAVRSFQNGAELDPTGAADVDTQVRLFAQDAPVSPERVQEQEADARAAEYVIRALAFGDTGEEVQKLQERLAELGFYSGKADGQYGTGTEESVLRFQQALGVPENGDASAGLINLLFSQAAPHAGTKYWKKAHSYRALSIGDTGDNVVTLQKRLYQLGYLQKEDVIDQVGTYEAYTADAVNRILKRLGCPRRDGRASSEFLTVLYSDAADRLSIR